MGEVFVEAYERLVTGVPITDMAHEVINSVILNNDRLSPTWHALGFIHCRISDYKTGQLRLHVWPPNMAHEKEQRLKIHDHLFTVNSCVIVGDILNVNYAFEIQERPCDSDFQAFNVVYTREGSALEPTGEFYKMTERQELSACAGECYQVERGVFHQTIRDPSKLVVTLVGTSGAEGASPRMMGAIEENNCFTREKVFCDRSVWLEQLNLALDSCRGSE